MELKKYITYEEPFKGRSFTINQLYEVYRDMVNKEEYPDFDCWFTDMLKSGVFRTCKRNGSADWMVEHIRERGKQKEASTRGI